MSPSTRPSTMTNLALMLPVTPPSLPMLSERVCSIEPSSWPWNSRSSSPYSSPLKCRVGPRTQVPAGAAGAGAGGAILASEKFLLMGFSASGRLGGGGGSVRPSIRLHRDSAIEICSLGDAHAGRADVAADHSRLTDLDAFLGDHVALDLAVDVDALGIDGGDDFALGTHDHFLLVVDRALDSALDLDVFLGSEFALEAQRRTEYRHAFTRCIH